MPLGLEPAANLGRNARLETDCSALLGRLAGRLRRAEVAESRGIAGLLHVHAEVDHVADHLRVTLGLHVAPHQAEAQPGPAVLGDKARNDRVERPLPRLESVEMRRGRVRIETPVLQRETQISRHMVRPEAVKIALDQAHTVEVAIDDRHVNRVGLHRVARHGA